jgi:hypothetical protein
MDDITFAMESPAIKLRQLSEVEETVWIVPHTILKSMIDIFKDNPLLRVHRHDFAFGYAEEPRVEVCHITRKKVRAFAIELGLYRVNIFPS